MYLSLVNLPLLASLEEKSTHRVLGCFLEAGDGNDLEKGFLVNRAAGGVFALFWEAIAEPEMGLKGLFLHLPCMVLFSVSFPVVVINGHC